ncbi:FxsA cytoplasmic membrane protein [Bartonella australis AUST/NH1]|uniref:FxsA cytoplasmic membrane protein n=1 Tax=Bartonella australis (strain Aust/NH1) TaxID=1094489 RepID=M1N283_BARAA|nr:FxsA family protein [Bartonella australis]AGF73999.1 FxsA cytoplasmic membrane protein [Bartonella australis AUST/NH1]
MTKFYHIKPRFFIIITLGILFTEIAGFILVGREIGILATLSLTLLTMISGIIVLRIRGYSLLQNIQSGFAQGSAPEYYVAENTLIIIGAILLVLPGFVSDILGIFLLIKPMRIFLLLLFKNRTNTRSRTNSNAQEGAEKIIELNAEDYQRYNTEESPWRKNDDDY